VSHMAIFDERWNNLYFAIIFLVCAKDLRGINVLSVVRDSPHIGGPAAKLCTITGLEQPAGEEMGPR